MLHTAIKTRGILVRMPEELEKRVLKLRGKEAYCNFSKAELVRTLIEIALKNMSDESNKNGG